MTMEQEQPEPKPRPLHEAQIATLRELYAAYGHQPFKPGDLVTPRAAGMLRFAGEPHLVLEVRDMPEPDFAQGGPGKISYGVKFDIRILAFDDDGDYVAVWFESWMFERYVPPKEAA